MNVIREKYPCREKFVKELEKFYGDESELLPKFVYMLGFDSQIPEILKIFFAPMKNTRSVIVNASECYTSRVLFHSILNGLSDVYETLCKTDELKDFLDELSTLDHEDPDCRFVIAIDNAEKLRDLEFNILPVFVKLQEYTGLNISCIMVSSIPLEKIHPKIPLSDVIKIHNPHLNKNDLVKIFLLEFPHLKQKMKTTISKSRQLNDKAEKLKILESLDENFYMNYLNIFFSMFYKVCRDVKELRFQCKKCFFLYCTPVLNKEIKKDDSNNLWKNIAGPMQSSLGKLYSRVDTQGKSQEKIHFANGVEEKLPSKYTQIVELPYYAKYLLIASFLASHNDAKHDKRLFMKYHGKQRKKVADVRNQAKLTEKMGIQTGPKSFTMDRLLAIFYAILDEKVGLTCNLLTQISTLIELNFITFLSGENNLLDGNARLQCTVGMEFITSIGSNVGFSVKKYLTDFH